MAPEGKRELERMLDAVRAISDPEERALKAQELIREFQAAIPVAAEIRRSGVLGMRDRGASHADVAQRLDISRSAAAQIAQGRTPED